MFIGHLNILSYPLLSNYSSILLIKHFFLYDLLAFFIDCAYKSFSFVCVCVCVCVCVYIFIYLLFFPFVSFTFNTINAIF